MTKLTQKLGKEAEKRVLELAKKIGEAREATPEEDYAQKIDIIMCGKPIQVSVSPKSKRTRRKLKKRGIANIPGGQQFTDKDILQRLLKLISKNYKNS